MSFLFNIIIFILLYASAKNTSLKDNDEVSLIYYEYSFNLSEINLIIKNKDVDILDSISCHLAFIKNLTKEKNEIFDFYSVYFNRQWIFFANNAETINKLLKIDYDKKDIYLLGILIPKSLNHTVKNDEDIPIFEIDDNYTNYMEKWDMRNATKNIYFTLEINHAVEYYREKYFLILSMIILTLSFSLLIYWKIALKKLAPANILHINKISVLLIYLNNLLSFLLLMKSINIRGKKIYDDESESSILLDTALLTLNGVHRTVFWFLALIISHGWNISIQQLNLRDCKFFLKMFLLIFFAVSVDQIIDVIFDPISRLNFSEVKNCIFYLLAIYYMLYKIDKNMNFLKLKIHYSMLVNPEYINALKYKILLFKKYRVLLISYFFAFLIVLILQKTIFYKYDEAIFEAYNYLALDCIFIYLFLILFRPKELPEHYNIDLGNNIEEIDGNIYKYNLPKYSETHLKIKDLSKKEVEECKKNNIPIIIIGPNVKNTNSIENNNNINIENSSINNYFLNLTIGFTENIK